MRFLILLFSLSLMAQVSVAAPPAGIARLKHRELARERTGKVRNVDLDRLQIDIVDAPPLGTVHERAAPIIPRRPLKRVGEIDQARLAQEVSERFRDFEVCRIKVARVANVPLSGIQAGEITLHWTILANGRTRGTLLFEVTDTDLALMKCSRRQMNSWRFTPPIGGVVDVEFDYDFSKGGPAAKESP